MKKIFIIFILIFLCSCATNKQIIKYEPYRFNQYIQLSTLKFLPFKNFGNNFKAKITFTLKNGKNYSFYALVYKNNEFARVFCYTFFGKQVLDILFGGKDYVVVNAKPEVYIIYPNKIDEKESIFFFLKQVLHGIELNNANIINDCITGDYFNYRVVSCKESNFKKVFFYSKNGNLQREFNINDDEIILKLNGNILQVRFKEKIKRKNFKKDFFTSIQNYKRYYVKNLKIIEDNILK